ncbi:MAG TPA: GNAT family protein [Longilinea sp.]|nr:GNAT family protein [Longilinea sp.]
MPLANLFYGTRIRLAAFHPEDAEIAAHWTEDGEYQRQMDTDFARPSTPAEQAEMLTSRRSSNSVNFALRTLDGDRLIGFVAIHSIEWNNQCGTLSMGIGEAEFRGKGYGSEALNLILNYAFNELNLYRVGLDVIGTNERAIRAYQKAGFREEGCLRASVFRDGQRQDRILMSVLRDEWQPV